MFVGHVTEIIWNQLKVAQRGGVGSEHFVVDDSKSCKSGTMDNIRSSDFTPFLDK